MITIEYWDLDYDLCVVTVNSRQEAISKVKELQSNGNQIIGWYFASNDTDGYSVAELILN
jgi:hypothetical protein